MEMGLDRISNLPSDLMNMILLRLPIREAVRTSVLSSKWRDKPSMLTHLVFNGRYSLNQNGTSLANVVDHVLLGHIGTIYSFQLHDVYNFQLSDVFNFQLTHVHSHQLTSRDVDRWIIHLSRNSIKEFVLMLEGYRYKVPSCLFSCEDMVELTLFNCWIIPPPTFEGFRSLKGLVLSKVSLTQDVFDNLIVSSPLLEELRLINCDGVNHLKIDAPNLRSIMVIGVFDDVKLENTNVTDASFGLAINVANDQRLDLGVSSNLLKFFAYLPRVQRLRIGQYFLKYLAVGVLPRKLPKPLVCLNALSLRIKFNDPREILTALCILRSSPHLRELEIVAWQEDEAIELEGEVNYALDDNRNCQFTQLRLVEITGISGVKAEQDFIRFLLSSSPVLEKMNVDPASVKDFPELVTMLLLQFRRASVNPEILVRTFDSSIDFGC